MTSTLQMQNVLVAKIMSDMPVTAVHIYIKTCKLHISGITHFPFFGVRVVQYHRHCTEPCQMAEVFVGLHTFKDWT